MNEDNVIDYRKYCNYNPGQIRYLNLLENKLKNNAWVYLASWGGIRAGKSELMCRIGLELSELFPGNVGLLTRKYNVDIADTIRKTFFDICPPELILDVTDGGERVILKTSGQPSEILFKGLYTSSGRPSKHGGLNLGWFGIDEASELTDDTDLNFLQGRLSLTIPTIHLGMLACNPPNKDFWIYKKFKENNAPNYGYVQIATYENKENLAENYIENLETTYNSAWQQRYLKGEPGVLLRGDPVFHNFSESTHCGHLEYMKEIPILRGWDFGYIHPVCECVQIDSGDRWNIILEQFGTNTYLKDFTPKVIAECNRLFPEAKYYDYCDFAGTQRSDKNEKTSIDILNDFAVYPEYRPTVSIKAGLELIQTLIDRNGIKVDDNCIRIKDALLGGYVRAAGKEDPLKEGYYEHCVDALRYIVMNTLGISGFWGEKQIVKRREYIRHRFY